MSKDNRKLSDKKWEKGPLKAIAAFVFSVAAVICLLLMMAAFDPSRFELVFSILLFVAIVFTLLASFDLRKASTGLACRIFVGLSAVIVFIALLGYIVYSNLYSNLPEHITASRVSRLRSDQRSLSTAIEAYFADHEVYPAWSMAGGDEQVGPTWNYRVAEFWEEMLAPAALPSFAMNSTATAYSYMTLTTPMAYITSYPYDHFAALKGTTFVYWSVNPGKNDPSGRITGTETYSGWILVSPGPDGVYDLPAECDVYDPSIPQPSARLLTGSNRFGGAFTYDPTNGMFSSGDVWRVKQ